MGRLGGPMQVKITVTKTDIKKSADALLSGKHCTPPTSCPVYQAFKRQRFNVISVCRNFYGVSYYVHLKNKKEREAFNLPQIANEFIHNYDKSASFLRHKPFSFTMEIPNKFIPRSAKPIKAKHEPKNK